MKMTTCLSCGLHIYGPACPACGTNKEQGNDDDIPFIKIDARDKVEDEKREQKLKDQRTADK